MCSSCSEATADVQANESHHRGFHRDWLVDLIETRDMYATKPELGGKTGQSAAGSVSHSKSSIDAHHHEPEHLAEERQLSTWAQLIELDNDFASVEEGRALYDGEKQDGKMHGFGKLIFHKGKNMHVFCGEHVEGQKHGKGVLAFKNGRMYKGQFRNGKFNGEAAMTWANGDSYHGQYVDDLKHGYGRFQWGRDGQLYEGNWVKGKRHGAGTYTSANGKTTQGVWDMDKRITDAHSLGTTSSPCNSNKPLLPIADAGKS